MAFLLLVDLLVNILQTLLQILILDQMLYLQEEKPLREQQVEFLPPIIGILMWKAQMAPTQLPQLLVNLNH